MSHKVKCQGVVHQVTWGREAGKKRRCPGPRIQIRPEDSVFVFFPRSDSNARGSWITLLISGDK